MKNLITSWFVSYICLTFLCACVPGETIKTNFDIPGEHIHADIDIESSPPVHLKKK